jgi:1-deoxy-D-xylulose-5-phosphate synthase
MLTVVNMRFVKPLDEKLVLELARTHSGLITVEDNAVMGGAGSAVAELLAAHGLATPILHLGLPDLFIEHMTREQLLHEVGLDVAGIKAAILKRWPQQPVPVRSAAG